MELLSAEGCKHLKFTWTQLDKLTTKKKKSIQCYQTQPNILTAFFNYRFLETFGDILCSHHTTINRLNILKLAKCTEDTSSPTI